MDLIRGNLLSVLNFGVVWQYKRWRFPLDKREENRMAGRRRRRRESEKELEQEERGLKGILKGGGAIQEEGEKQ